MRQIAAFAIRCLARVIPKSIERAVRQPGGYDFDATTTINDIRRLSLDYIKRMAVFEGRKLTGYRHSMSTDKPNLYATIAALALKHLYGHRDSTTEREIELIREAQSDDGLFRDPVIACPEAEKLDWWGWRHLTLHALMVLALYEKPAPKRIAYLYRFSSPGSLTAHLKTLDWGKGAADTSNAVQNIGVMLQYARDYQDDNKAALLLEELYRFLDDKQDPATGLYGDSFRTPYELSYGCQAGYHLWLLYFYDKRPVNHMDKIIDNLLKTQNIMGGYGVKWNSSACEDIDAIDPLLRLSRLTSYRYADIQASLAKALPAVLSCLNGDGGWAFRKHESFTIGHPQLYSAPNESTVLHTWFRTLGLAYLLLGLQEVPPSLNYNWEFKIAPGHQYL